MKASIEVIIPASYENNGAIFPVSSKKRMSILESLFDEVRESIENDNSIERISYKHNGALLASKDEIPW